MEEEWEAVTKVKEDLEGFSCLKTSKMLEL